MSLFWWIKLGILILFIVYLLFFILDKIFDIFTDKQLEEKQVVYPRKNKKDIHIKSSNKYILAIQKLVDTVPNTYLYEWLSKKEIDGLSLFCTEEYKKLLAFTRGANVWWEYWGLDLMLTWEDGFLDSEAFWVKNWITIFNIWNGDEYVLSFWKDGKEKIHFLMHENGTKALTPYSFSSFIDQLWKFVLWDQDALNDYN